MAYRLEGELKDLDGFTVKRILPNAAKRMVGPFVFIDHMGPAEFEPGEGIDVRPHPHIGLSTITYMLDGSLLHRDSLGNNLEILPGDVNWMTAGSGIVHSERETIEVKARAHKLNGMQCWIALPESMAEIAPSFTQVKCAQLPQCMEEGVVMRLVAGEAYGLTAPIKTYSPMFFLDVLARKGKQVHRPNPEQECLIYLLNGQIDIGNNVYRRGDCLILENDSHITAHENARWLMLGGEAWPKSPYMYWNFVSFDRDRIERAKQEWRERRFPVIPGDANEFTPLPED